VPRLYVVAGKVTDSVTYGFLPAAERLGLHVIVLTDRPDDHRRAYPHHEIVSCDVTEFREIIHAVQAPDAIFSNSDFLQAPAALAADYWGLPGKDWRAATRTKNKALMRRHLGDEVWAAELTEDLVDAPYPLVLKPREGVASEDVVLVRDHPELAARRAEIGDRRPLIVEEYLPGRLHTLETLGDGRALHVLGSFRTTLSPPPYFIEERLDWAPPPAESGQVLDRLRALGVGFGACHTEFVVYDGQARLIEVNYRIIGDHCDFLLADLLGRPLFEDVLRVHLGEPLRAQPTTAQPTTAQPTTAQPTTAQPTTAGRAAIVDYVLTDRPGMLTAAPGPAELSYDGVRVTYRPQRTPGSAVALTHTNRDYLGTIQAIGPGRTAVEGAVARFRADHTWNIS
jgi:biotin carboxylase